MGFEGLVLLCTLLGPSRSQWCTPKARQPENGPASGSGWVYNLGESHNQTEQRLPTFLLPDA